MDRRQFVQGISVMSVVGLAGCSGIFEEDPEDDYNTSTPPEGSQETFEYFFNDQTGTLGQVGDQNIPEDAPTERVVENSRAESDWQEMESNDVEEVRNRMEENVAPNGSGYDTTVDEISSRTQEILNNPEEAFSDDPEAFYPVEDITEEDDAVVYTRALTAATWELAGLGSSGAAGAIIPAMAEPVLDRVDMNISEFSLSKILTSEALDQGFEDSAVAVGGLPRDVSTGDSAEKMKINSGLKHPVGLLQYTDQDGNQQLKYTEVTGNQQSLFPEIIRDPAESNYAMPLGSEPEIYQNQLNHPEHFVGALEYSKAREIQNMGGLTGPNRVDWALGSALYNIVDDAGNDQGPSNEDVEAYGDTPGWDIIVEDSFGESLEEFKQNPTREQTRYFENAGRGLKLAFEKQGYDEPLRISGTLEDPTFEHLARDEFEQIIDERQQRISS